MSLWKKAVFFYKDNIVAIYSVAIIIGVHYGWVKLQDVPQLVDSSEKKDLPILIASRRMADSIAEKYRKFVEPSDGKKQ